MIPILLLSGCSDKQEIDQEAIRFAIATMPQNLDPRFATDAVSERINQLLYARLVNFDESLLPRPGIADWQQLDSLTYVFDLKPDRMSFANGEPVTAVDVVATYEFVLDKNNVSPHRQSLSVIESVDAIAGDRVEFKLKFPDPLFPAYLQLGIMPAGIAGQKQIAVENLVSSGTFSLVSKKQGRVVIKRRSDDQVVVFEQVKDPTVRVLKLLNGEVDLMQNDLAPEMMAYLKKQNGIKNLRRKGQNFSYIGFNLEDNDTSKHRLRKAIAHAINREEIIRYVFQSSASPAESILPSSHWAGHQELNGYAYKPELSRRTLQELGYDFNNPLRLVYKTSTDPFRIKLATVIQNQLKAVGIELEIKSYDWGTFFGDIKSGNFQMYSLSWVGINTPDIFKYVFHSKSLPPDGANRGRYKSSRLDNLLDQAQKATSLEQQKLLFHQVQEIVHSDLPYIPLWYEDQVAFAAEDIHGYKLSPNGNYLSLNDIRRSKTH